MAPFRKDLKYIESRYDRAITNVFTFTRFLILFNTFTALVFLYIFIRHIYIQNDELGDFCDGFYPCGFFYSNFVAEEALSYTVSMLLFMWSMYKNTKANFTIIGISIVVFFGCLYGLRTQTPIGDIQWMKAMIPHHSSAILTSSNANFKDAEVQKLANDIIKAQEKEIAEMKAMIKRLEQNK